MNNVQNQNGRLIFFNEELHKYTDDLNNVYISTTTLIGKYKEPFDTDYWAEFKAKERGITKEEVLKEWKDITEVACDNGNKKHGFLEDTINISTGYIKYKVIDGVSQLYTVDEILEDNTKGLVSLTELIDSGLQERYPEIFEVVYYLATKGYRLYAEICVFDYKHLVSGAIDLLAILFDDNNKPIDGYIIDWKTNKESIKEQAGYYKKDVNGNYTGRFIELPKKKLLFPLNHLPESKLSIYGMQLNTYAYMVELRGFPIRKCILFHIRSKEQIKLVENRDITNDEEIVHITIPDYRKEVKLMFADHYRKNIYKVRNIQSKLI